MTLDETLQLAADFQSQTNPMELLELYNGVLKTPKGAVVEVGSASGGTTIALISAAEQVGKMVYSVDPYPEELEGVADHFPVGLMAELKEKFSQNILNGRWKNIRQFNVDVKKCGWTFPKLSVVFIDGLHELQCVKDGFEVLFPKLVPGGRMYIHDTNWKVGQLSKTFEGAVCHATKLMTEDKFTDIRLISSMLCGTKI